LPVRIVKEQEIALWADGNYNGTTPWAICHHSSQISLSGIRMKITANVGTE
jgi:hypothetical protein